jgi:hypothetical protein
MRLPRVQFTVRRMMVAVAIVAAMFAIQRMYQHWSRCQRRSAYHDQRRAIFTSLADNGVKVFDIAIAIPNHASTKLGMALGLLDQQNGEERVHSLAESIQYHTDMREKYDRVAWYPWSPIMPDPPPPEP